MTREQQTTKNFFKLNGGLNTEASELSFPDGYTTDEANYELLLDGSRRRRKGLADESGVGTALTVATHGGTQWNQTYVWRNVNGDPTLDIVVYRKAKRLYFATATETISTGWYTGTDSFVDMEQFETSGATTALTDSAPVTFSQGRGRLLVSGQYIYPFYVEWDGSSFTATRIYIRIRDFGDIEDGIATTTEPTGTITADHKYNLRNRGWKQDDLDTVYSGLSKHPAKNSLWYRGYTRKADQNTPTAVVGEAFGTASWDNTKFDGEFFGNSTAPRGSVFIDPYDSTIGYGGEKAATTISITAHTYDNGTGIHTLTTASAHGLTSADQVVIDGNSFGFNYTIGGTTYYTESSLDGVQDLETGTTGSTLKISASLFLFSGNFTNISYGEAITDILTRSIGTAHSDSTAAVEWHAGRAFYGGMANSEWADTIFYSQIVDVPAKFGRCYQEADPTDPDFNQLVSTDGGTIVIPGMGGVTNMVSTRNALLVLGTEGVWEVSGGQRGVFTADGYSVRKLSEAGCSASCSVVKIENTVIYTGPGGIYVVAPNQYTGLLEVTNVIETTIQTLWNQITTAEQEHVQAFYDDAQKRAYFLIGPNATTNFIDTALVYDAKIGAWFKYTFPTPTANGLLTGFAVPTADDPTTNKKAKFIYEASTSTVQVADFAQTAFTDWDGTEQLPYMYTAWDNLGDFQRRRQAPVVTVFSVNTETGYTDTGTSWEPVNDSSTLMSAYWDWTNDAITNKITATQEVYRKVRDFAPASASDVDGYPVVVTRNKVRGRGRVLQLKFEGATGKDSHLLGFTVNYKVSRRK